MRRGLWVLAALCACGDDGASRTDAATDGVVADGTLDANPFMPQTLAETGLCLDAGCTQIAPGVREYTPHFELYSDTATKKRWIYLPPGTQIDTSDMDFWQFPVGTKLWKEFTRGGTRVETRLVWRIGAGTASSDWFYAAYVWNATQDATHWAEFGEVDANGTPHDVPGKALCRQCHENVKPSRVLGFSAIQLDLDGPGTNLDLADLITLNLLSNPPTRPSTAVPFFPFDGTSDPTVKPALGYLHANCSHCHNPTSSVQNNTLLNLRLTVGTVGTTATTAAYTTAVNVMTQNAINGHNTIVYKGDPSMSVMIDRFEATNGNRMPAAGTEFMDTTGDTILKAWIAAIPP